MKKFLLSLFAIICFLTTANAETYTHIFAKDQLTADAGEVELSGIVWTKTEATAIDWHNTKGIQIGEKNNATASYTLSTSFGGLKIRSVKVVTSRVSASDVKMTISVGDQISEEFTPGTTNTDCFFDCEDTVGEIKINWSRSGDDAKANQAYYVYSITIEYTPDASSIVIPDPEFNTPVAIYTDKVLVRARCENAKTIIFYTLDGTEPSYEDWANGTGSTKRSGYNVIEENITSTTTIKMIAVITDEEVVFKSGVVEETYFVSRTMPYIPASEIVSGKKYTMIAADSAATFNYNNEAQGYLSSKTAKKINSKYSNSVEAAGFTFTTADGGYTIQDKLGRYISHTGTEATLSFTTELPANGAVWSIATNDEGKATISCDGYAICYTASSATFGCYPVAQLTEEQQLPQLFMQREYPQYTITPASGSKMGKLESITVYCEEGIKAIQDTIYDEENNMILRDLKIEADGFETEFTLSQLDSNTLVFTANEPIVSHNNYDISINITAGDIILNPEVMEMSLPVPVKYGVRTIAKYTITGDAEAAVIEDVSPADGAVVNELSYFIFTFSYYVSHSTDAALAPKLHLEGSDELIALEKSLTKPDGSAIGMQSAAFKTLSPVTAEGKYILEIPTGYFSDGNGFNLEGVTLHYTVDSTASIDDITANDEGCWVVYNIGGVKVLDTKEANKIKELPSGVYIINGIKAVVK